MQERAMILLPFLLLLRIVIETYANSYGEIDWHWAGNALVGALPAMTLGYVIHIKEEKLMKANIWALLASCLVSIVCMFLTVNARIGELDISQIFKISTAALVMLICLKEKDLAPDNIVSTFGAEGSLFIYIAHPLVGQVFEAIFAHFTLTAEFIQYGQCWVVVAATLVVAVITVFVKRGAKYLINKIQQSKLKQA